MQNTIISKQEKKETKKLSETQIDAAKDEKLLKKRKKQTVQLSLDKPLALFVSVSIILVHPSETTKTLYTESYQRKRKSEGNESTLLYTFYTLSAICIDFTYLIKEKEAKSLNCWRRSVVIV